MISRRHCIDAVSEEKELGEMMKCKKKEKKELGERVECKEKGERRGVRGDDGV